jgi:hypothetical protein
MSLGETSLGPVTGAHRLYPAEGKSEKSKQSSTATTPTPQHPVPSRMAGACGGVADKLGNKYELAWAIRHGLFCIQDERRSLTLEEIDPELADGSEFTMSTSTASSR